jgi:chemotaxis protein MotA
VLATLIGIVLAVVGVFAGAVLKGADPVALFTNVPALLIVFVGTVGATMTSHSMAETVAAMRALKKVFFPGQPIDHAGTVATIAALAGRARNDGLLALEGESTTNPDPFLRKGLRMTVDGVDSDTLRDSLVTDIKAMRERHKVAAGWWTQAGVFSPTFGIIGAVVGLMAVLSKLDDPEKLGYGIGAAFVATFWGIFLANGLFLPWGNRLKRLSADEVAHREMVVQGVMALQAGTLPRTLEEKLSGYLPPGERKAS